MIRVLSLLMLIPLLSTQVWAIRGGPYDAFLSRSLTAIAGTYGVAMRGMRKDFKNVSTHDNWTTTTTPKTSDPSDPLSEIVYYERDPGSDARVQVETLDGGNHLVTLTATNVTPPDRIGSGNTVYLVWVRTPTGQAQMESQLAYQPDQRTGRATITTPQRSFTLLVTAERDASATTPGEHLVLSQEIQL